METKGIFQFWNHHRYLSLSLFDSFEYVWYGSTVNFFQCGDRLYASESDVYRRQVLTYKDGPRAVRVKPTLAKAEQNKLSRILWHSMALTSNVFTELANTIKYGEGSYKIITLFLPSSHSKGFPVTSLRFTEYILQLQPGPCIYRTLVLLRRSPLFNLLGIVVSSMFDA